MQNLWQISSSFLLRKSTYEVLTNLKFVFAYEVGDLIFCGLDVTSSPSPVKRMYV